MQAWLKAFSAGRSSALSTVKYRNPSGEGGPAGLSSPGCEEHHPVLSLSIMLPSELAAALQHSLSSSSRAAGVCWKKLWLVDAPRQATHYSRFPPLSPHLRGGGGTYASTHAYKPTEQQVATISSTNQSRQSQQQLVMAGCGRKRGFGAVYTVCI